jgi:regulatory protein
MESKKRIKAICLQLLARRDHSVLELIRKLKVKGFELSLINEVLAQLLADNYLNEQRYAESFTRQRILKGYGPKRIEYELNQAGIDDFDMDSVLDETAGSWMDVIAKVYEKKFSQETVISPNEWAKRSRFLQQRGFTGSMVSALFKTLNIRFE